MKKLKFGPCPNGTFLLILASFILGQVLSNVILNKCFVKCQHKKADVRKLMETDDDDLEANFIIAENQKKVDLDLQDLD